MARLTSQQLDEEIAFTPSRRTQRALTELRERRAAEVELHKRANFCRSYSEMSGGVYPANGATLLLDLIDRLGEEGEKANG